MNYGFQEQYDSPGADSPERSNTVDTNATCESYEFSRREAEEINRSMDSSMEFWGFVRESSAIIPAHRLKIAYPKSQRESRIAREMWRKMNPDDIDNVRKVEGILLSNGEIRIEQLFEALERIADGVGLGFQDVFPESENDDIISSATAVMNELMILYNRNVGTKGRDVSPTFNKKVEFTFPQDKYELQSHKSLSPDSSDEDMSPRIDYLLKKAERYGIHDLKVPSSPSLSEQSKFHILEKQIDAKIRLQRVKKIISSQKMKSPTGKGIENRRSGSASDRQSSHSVRRDLNKKRRMENEQNKPGFRTAVKPQQLEYFSLVKNVPGVQKRLKKKLNKLKQSDNWEKIKNNLTLSMNKPSLINSVAKCRPSSLSEKQNVNSIPILSNKSHSVDSSMKPSVTTLHSSKESTKSTFSTVKYHGPRSSNLEMSTNIVALLANKTPNKEEEIKETSTTSKQPVVKASNESISRDEMLIEMKKLLKEAIQEIGVPNSFGGKGRESYLSTMTKEVEEQTSLQYLMASYCQTSTPEISFVEQAAEVKEDAKEVNSQVIVKEEEVLDTAEEMKVDIQRLVVEDEDTLDIRVTQETVSPLLWPLARDPDRTITTEIAVTQSNPCPSVKLSVVHKVKSEEEGLSWLAKEQPERVQQAVTYLTDLLGSRQEDSSKMNDNEEPSGSQNKPLEEVVEGGNAGTTDKTQNIPISSSVVDEPVGGNGETNEQTHKSVTSFSISMRGSEGSDAVENEDLNEMPNLPSEEESHQPTADNLVKHSEGKDDLSMESGETHKSDVESISNEPPEVSSNAMNDNAHETGSYGVEPPDDDFDEGLLPPLNVNMVILEGYGPYHFGQREEPRSYRLFQLSVPGQEPPRIVEEIGDVGSSVWLNGGCWSQHAWPSRSQNVTLDSMDSLYVNPEDRPPSVEDVEGQPLRRDRVPETGSPVTSLQKLSLSEPSTSSNQSPPSDNISQNPSESEINLKESSTPELIPSAKSPLAGQNQGTSKDPDEVVKSVGSSTKEKQSTSKSSDDDVILQDVAKSGPIATRPVSKTVMNTLGIIMTGILLSMKWPVTGPYRFFKFFWSNIFGRIS